MKTALWCGLAICLVLGGCARDRKRDRHAPTLVPVTRESSTPTPEPSRPPPAAGIQLERQPAALGSPPWSEAVCAVTLGALQHELADHGHATGPVDGRWGPHTEAALREFQLGRGLPVTGLPDRLTLEGLFTEEAVPIQRVRGTESPPAPPARSTNAVSFGGGLGLGLLAAIALLATKRKGGSFEPPPS